MNAVSAFLLHPILSAVLLAVTLAVLLAFFVNTGRLGKESGAGVSPVDLSAP